MRMMTKMNNDFISLVKLAVKKSALKKLIFSRPKSSEVAKITARLTERRGMKMLALEYSLPGNTVSQRNISEAAIDDELTSLFEEYKQINLITAVGDAERRISKKGKELLLGIDALTHKLSTDEACFESAIEALDRRKNYIFTGEEEFFRKLQISDKNGRIHDKKQGKFRQINRFLEHIEDLYPTLPQDGIITVYDLCSGKSYLSFALYYYLHEIKGREVYMLGIDLKRDVIEYCKRTAEELGYQGMHFIADDVMNTPCDKRPDLLISLHACDIATDIVINEAIRLGAKIILSTPCCHRYLNDKLSASSLKFVSDYPHIRNKLCEALTDGIRLARLRANGYKTQALELTDPENTPKNTLIKAVLNERMSDDVKKKYAEEYEAILTFALGDGRENYLSEIKRK